ncbi:MAG: hypothetical protein WCB04_10200 [Mycobacteriales bacterium]
MTIGETLSVFAGIPILVIFVVASAVYAANARTAPRYRPGRPFTFTPVWYLAEASPDEAAHHEAPKAITAAPGAGTPVVQLDPGGARGTW